MDHIVQIEIQVSNLAAAEKFYRSAFNWPRTPTDMHNYTILDVPPAAGYGVALIENSRSQPTAQSVTVYFKCDELEKTLEAVKTGGGKVLFGPKYVAPYGTIYHICDPDGNRWGLFRDDAKPRR